MEGPNILVVKVKLTAVPSCISFSCQRLAFEELEVPLLCFSFSKYHLGDTLMLPLLQGGVQDRSSNDISFVVSNKMAK